MSIEQEVANRLAHQDNVKKILANTGGEVIHPDHYEIRENIRCAVLQAIDENSPDGAKMSDGELPNLFKILDAIAERIFLKSVGL